MNPQGVAAADPRPRGSGAVLCEAQRLLRPFKRALWGARCLYREPRSRLRKTRAITLVPMFTGIVRERARIASVEPRREGMSLRVTANTTADGLAPGDSVAVNGVCLTLEDADGGELAFWAGRETLGRTTLGRLETGGEVNLEPALRAGDPLGGHLVQGHVDAVGRVRRVDPEGEGARLWFDAPEPVLRYCAEKGSIAVDGVSLTVAALDDDGFAVALVPFTLDATTLGALVEGDDVNLEADVLAKYVERLLSSTQR